MFAAATFARRLAVAMQPNRFEAFPGHEAGNRQQDDDESDSDGEIYMSGALKPLDDLSASFNSRDRADYHDEAEFQIDVAKRPMFSSGDNRFSHDMGQVGAYDEIHWNADRV